MEYSQEKNHCQSDEPKFLTEFFVRIDSIIDEEYTVESCNEETAAHNVLINNFPGVKKSVEERIRISVYRPCEKEPCKIFTIGNENIFHSLKV